MTNKNQKNDASNSAAKAVVDEILKSFNEASLVDIVLELIGRMSLEQIEEVYKAMPATLDSMYHNEVFGEGNEASLDGARAWLGRMRNMKLLQNQKPVVAHILQWLKDKHSLKIMGKNDGGQFVESTVSINQYRRGKLQFRFRTADSDQKHVCTMTQINERLMLSID